MPRFATLTVGTWNIGNGNIADGKDMARSCDAVAWQEAGDQDAMMAAIRSIGMRVIRPSDQAGQDSTPLAFNPDRLTLLNPFARLIAPGQWVGEGPGPDNMKPKWLIGGYFLHIASGQRVFIGCVHAVSGQDNAKREQVATEAARNVHDALDDYQGIAVVAGDWNTGIHGESLRPLLNHGWTSNHIAGGRVGTFGGDHPIDQVLWKRDSRVRFKAHNDVPNSSDHDGLVVRLDLLLKAGAPGNPSGGGGGGGQGGGGNPPAPYDPSPQGPPLPPSAHSGKGRATLDGRPFRLNPTSVDWDFTAKVADIATVGGKVVQVLGTNVSNIRLSGTFGAGGWREQERFLSWIKDLADKGTRQKPVRFRYPRYGWDFPVFIKAYTTPDGGRSIVLDNGIVAPRWDLTLFVVSGSAGLDKIAKDAFIARMAKGLGWKQTKFNGPQGLQSLSEVLGMSVEEYLEQQYGIGSVATGNQDYTADPIDVGPLPLGGSPERNRQLGRALASRMYGWDGAEWEALEALWTAESGWDHLAENPSSGAYGIPQSLPASKMATIGKDYRTNPVTQIKWGLKYIKERSDYGSPSKAWALWQSRDPHWY